MPPARHRATPTSKHKATRRPHRALGRPTSACVTTTTMRRRQRWCSVRMPRTHKRTERWTERRRRPKQSSKQTSTCSVGCDGVVPTRALAPSVAWTLVPVAALDCRGAPNARVEKAAMALGRAEPIGVHAVRALRAWTSRRRLEQQASAQPQIRRHESPADAPDGARPARGRSTRSQRGRALRVRAQLVRPSWGAREGERAALATRDRRQPHEAVALALVAEAAPAARICREWASDGKGWHARRSQ